MAPIRLTLAVHDYDHVRDLASGRIPVEGIELTCLNYRVEEIFFRFTNYREWDISEMSLAKYVALRSRGDNLLTAIPVFTSRMFRHSSWYVRADGPSDPRELAGMRVGVPEWSQTAAVYSRGILQEDYGVPLSSVMWFQGGVNEPGRTEKVAIELPEGVMCTRVTDRSLDEMLLAGDLGAVLTAHAPASFDRHDGSVRRLVEDYVPIEREYAARTGIYPIMHLIALRTEVLEHNPWVAMNLFDAFEESKRRSVSRMSNTAVSGIPMPWISEQLDTLTDELFDGDWWPYGLEPNRKTLETFVDFAYEQGVAGSRIEIEELFDPRILTHWRD